MRFDFRWRRPPPLRQPTFDFFRRSRRPRRVFKLGICAFTLLAVALILAVHPQGRYVVASAAPLARRAARQAFHLDTPRAEINEQWRRQRLRGIADAERGLVASFDAAPPSYQRLMQFAGLDPDHGLLRWGNFDRTLLLPSTVFEADDSGRSYRLLPGTRSIWLRNVSIKSGVLMFFLVPDTAGLNEAMAGTTAIPVDESRQSTNSWGLRGPEPDLGAPTRGIVLGDSFMQGLFVSDQHTPPECLRRDLEHRLKVKVSLLNTGHLGYAPEQYYCSLTAFADRFQPQFVVVSYFANDFGYEYDALDGRADWEEGCYWLGEIARYCRAKQWPCLFVPVPLSTQMFSRRKAGYYPGMVSNLMGTSALESLNPLESFLNAHLEHVLEGERRGNRPTGCPLFNEAISDGHFSALGSEVWAGVVGRRLELLLERNHATGTFNHPER